MSEQPRIVSDLSQALQHDALRRGKINMNQAPAPLMSQLGIIMLQRAPASKDLDMSCARRDHSHHLTSEVKHVTPFICHQIIRFIALAEPEDLV